MAGNEMKLLWKKNQVLQVVGLKHDIQRQPIVLHRYCFGILKINWRLHVQNSTVFFFITQKTGNVIILFKKKKWGLLLRVWFSFSPGSPAGSLPWSSPKEYNCFPTLPEKLPDLLLQRHSPTAPQHRDGHQQHAQALTGSFLLVYTITYFQYKNKYSENKYWLLFGSL